MQVEYKKEWMDTYLWILPEQQLQESYVEQMLLYNQGEGRLEFSRQEKEGEEYFCYKVTGKKALNSVYAVLPIGDRQIRSILGQLFETLEKGREYLLSEEDFVLSPKYIFTTFPQMDLEFCYVPGYGVPLREQLESLFEYLLNRVDYEDKPAVNLLYDCYMFCMKEKGGLSEIKKLLEKKTTVAEVKAPEPEAVRPVEPLPVVYPTSKKTVEKRENSASYVSRLTEKLFHRWKKEMPLVAEEREEYGVASASVKKETADVKVLKEDMEESERTVLLAAKKRPAVPELICEQTGEVIPLTKFPFYIGSAEEFSDFVATGEGVSRIHCCINKKEDKYYLADLNSTNGTFLNQQEVFPGKDALLSANDEIRVTSQEFYIKFPCH